MRYTALADPKTVELVTKNLIDRGYEVINVKDRVEALEKIKSIIPAGASVINGSSVTLEEIGFVEYLKSGKHGWKNLHGEILAESDRTKQSILRKQATLSDYYLGSVHGLAENGEFVIASNTGSQLPHIVFNSANLIFVVGAQKIVPTLDDALKRIEEYVYPLEDKHMKDKYGVGSMVSKIVIFKHENPFLGRKIRFILVNEKLGF